MRWVKLIVFIVLAGVLVGANLLFKDRLAERALEAALESLFRARSEVDGLRLKLLAGKVAFRSLAVADEQEPMTNLFELGPTEADIDVVQLLSRKVVIESVACSDIRWGTPRAASGALPGSEAAAAPAAARSGSGLTLPGLEQIGFDPDALLAAERANLKSPAAYEQANASLKEGSERWKSRAADLSQKVERLGAATMALQKIDFRSVKSPDEARRSYEAVQAVAPVLSDAQTDLRGAGGDLQADLGKLRAGVAVANTLIEQDIRYLRSRVALPEGGLKGAVSGLARGMIEKRLGRFSSLAFRALEAAGRMREKPAGAKKDGPTTKASRRPGRDVPFPTTSYPGFLLKSFAFSVKPDGGSLAGELKDLSSNPEMWGKPATFGADYSAGGRSARVSGELDTRETATRARIDAQGTGFDFALNDLPLIGTAAGAYRFATTADVDRNGVTGQAQVTTGAIRVGEARDVAGRVVRDALAGAKEVAFDIGYRMSGGDFALTLKSSLDEEIGRQLASRLADLKADYQKQAEAQLRTSLAPQIARAQEQLGALGGTGGQITALDGRTEGYRREIDAKKAEYTAALNRLGGGLLKLPGF